MEDIAKRERDWLDKVRKENEECDWDSSLEETKILNCLDPEFKLVKDASEYGDIVWADQTRMYSIANCLVDSVIRAVWLWPVMIDRINCHI